MFRLCFVLLAMSTPMLHASDWVEFRGPDGTGQYVGPKLVTEWGTEKNGVWKAKVAGKGWSSPIVVKGTVIVTTAVPDDAKPKPNYSLRAVAVDAVTGKPAWDVELFAMDGAKSPGGHSKNSFASSTPVSDGERVFVHFGHLGTACLDLDGKIVWKVDSYKYAPVHGNGGSPILVGDSLVFSVDGSDQQYVAALDKMTGSEKWKTDRKSTASKRFSFTTPFALTSKGKTIIVSAASEFVAGYDAVDGKEIWRAKYPSGGYSLIARPIFVNGLLIIQTGYDTANLFAIDPTGTGDISAKIVWTTKKGAPHTPSPIAHGDEVYTVTDQGFMTCFDAKTGTIHWSERLKGKGYSASPIVADGKIYAVSEDGVCSVVEAAKAFKVVGESELKEQTFSTFAASDGGLFVRTETMLYRFQAK